MSFGVDNKLTSRLRLEDIPENHEETLKQLKQNIRGDINEIAHEMHKNVMENMFQKSRVSVYGESNKGGILSEFVYRHSIKHLSVIRFILFHLIRNCKQREDLWNLALKAQKWAFFSCCYNFE